MLFSPSSITPRVDYCNMALPEHAVEAIETIPLCYQGDQWQDEWDSILEDVFWEAQQGPTTTQDLTPVDATLMRDMSKTSQRQLSAKQCKSNKKNKKGQGSRSVHCCSHTSPGNPLPEIQPHPTVQQPQPPPPPSFLIQPAYNPWVQFQTHQGFGHFHCYCLKYHIYHQSKMMGKPVRGRRPNHDDKCPLKSGRPLSFNVAGK